MRLARTLLGVIAAVGVARLLAPNETQDMLENAKRAMKRGVSRARHTAVELEDSVLATATGRVKSAANRAARKTSAPRTRKAARRPKTSTA